MIHDRHSLIEGDLYSIRARAQPGGPFAPFVSQVVAYGHQCEPPMTEEEIADHLSMVEAYRLELGTVHI